MGENDKLQCKKLFEMSVIWVGPTLTCFRIIIVTFCGIYRWHLFVHILIWLKFIRMMMVTMPSILQLMQQKWYVKISIGLLLCCSTHLPMLMCETTGKGLPCHLVESSCCFMVRLMPCSCGSRINCFSKRSIELVDSLVFCIACLIIWSVCYYLTLGPLGFVLSS